MKMKVAKLMPTIKIQCNQAHITKLNLILETFWCCNGRKALPWCSFFGGVSYALDTNAELKSAFTGGGSSFVTNGLDTSAWLYNAGAGISGMLSENVELNLPYDIDFSRSSYTNQMASAGVKVLL